MLLRNHLAEGKQSQAESNGSQIWRFVMNVHECRNFIVFILIVVLMIVDDQQRKDEFLNNTIEGQEGYRNPTCRRWDEIAWNMKEWLRLEPIDIIKYKDERLYINKEYKFCIICFK